MCSVRWVYVNSPATKALITWRCWSDEVLKWPGFEVTRCWSDQVLKWPGVEVTRSWSDQVLKWPGVEVTRCWSDQVLKWPGLEVTRCWSDQVLKWPGLEVTRCWSDQALKWPGVEVTRCRTRNCQVHLTAVLAVTSVWHTQHICVNTSLTLGEWLQEHAQWQSEPKCNYKLFVSSRLVIGDIWGRETSALSVRLSVEFLATCWVVALTGAV